MFNKKAWTFGGMLLLKLSVKSSDSLRESYLYSHRESKSDRFFSPKSALLCGIDAISTEIIYSCMKSDKCQCVQCIHIYFNDWTVNYISRPCIYQIGVCHVFPEFRTLV